MQKLNGFYTLKKNGNQLQHLDLKGGSSSYLTTYNNHGGKGMHHFELVSGGESQPEDNREFNIPLSTRNKTSVEVNDVFVTRNSNSAVLF